MPPAGRRAALHHQRTTRKRTLNETIASTTGKVDTASTVIEAKQRFELNVFTLNAFL